MKIQSLSVVVPNKKCINNCASCPSRMHADEYPSLLNEMRPDFDLRLKDYMKRLEFARDNGCNTVMLTGTSEPQQNRRFLTLFGMMMQMMEVPFRSIEMQCTGVLLDDGYLQFLRRHVGVTLMALSVFSLNKELNREAIRPLPQEWEIDPLETAKQVKETGMALRMCLNLTKWFDTFTDCPEALFHILKTQYKADQVTLRVLYAGEDKSPENLWVKENRAGNHTVERLNAYIRENGTLLGRLPYGACKYGIDGMSVVIDDDCMGKKPADTDSYKFLILRPDCRLYSSWDDAGSLVF